MSVEMQRPEIVGEIGGVAADGRLVIPVEVRKAVTWLVGKDPVPLIAELVSPGRIRLLPTSAVQHLLDEARERLTRDHERSLDHLAAFADRYRHVRYYPSDTRVHFRESVALYLSAGLSGDHPVYVEALGDHIDVMTLSVRNARLERLRADTDLLAQEH